LFNPYCVIVATNWSANWLSSIISAVEAKLNCSTVRATSIVWDLIFIVTCFKTNYESIWTNFFHFSSFICMISLDSPSEYNLIRLTPIIWRWVEIITFFLSNFDSIWSIVDTGRFCRIYRGLVITDIEPRTIIFAASLSIVCFITNF